MNNKVHFTEAPKLIAKPKKEHKVTLSRFNTKGKTKKEIALFKNAIQLCLRSVHNPDLPQ